MADMEIDESFSTSADTANTTEVNTSKIRDENIISPASIMVTEPKTITNISRKIQLVPAEKNMETPRPSCSISNPASKRPLDGWTKEEKYQLYLGIKYKTSKKIQEIQENIPTKTLTEIKVAIAHYKALANQNPVCTSRKLKIRKCRTKPLIPLASWAKILTDNFNYNELQTEIVSAIRLIADLENIPEPKQTEQIDFRKVYHQIADAMEGKALPDTRLISEVLKSCVLDTILVSKQFIQLSTFKYIINSVNFKEKSLPFFPRPTQDNELAIIQHFCTQRNYNPLGIAEQNLRASLSIPNVTVVSDGIKEVGCGWAQAVKFCQKK